MRYYKQIESGYILAVGTGSGYTEITAEEYAQIMAVIESRPIPADGKDYRLTESLAWEEYDRPIVDDEEATEEDYLSALAVLGVQL